jgi:hypothetical protein
MLKGTLPFMAKYLCENEGAYHSAVHDCESTFWLIPWTIAFIAYEYTDDKELQAELENMIIKPLRPDDWTLTDSAIGKDSLLQRFLLGILGRKDSLPEPFHPFIPLLKNLAELVTTYHASSVDLLKHNTTFTRKQEEGCILEYLNALRKHPVDLTDWGYIKKARTEESANRPKPRPTDIPKGSKRDDVIEHEP